jgi:polyphosphate kinase
MKNTPFPGKISSHLFPLKNQKGDPGAAGLTGVQNERLYLFGRPNPELFLNREVSWLQFNYRVLEEADRADNPLLERLKFLTISESNLNEFFMVRVAGLKQVIASNIDEIHPDGLTTRETLRQISLHAHRMVDLQYILFNKILHELDEIGIEVITDFRTVKQADRHYIADFFEREVFRVLTPLAVDPAHPFPHITNGRLNQAVTLEKLDGSGELLYAFVEVPNVLPRFLELPHTGKRDSRYIHRLIPLEEILKLHAGDLFSGTVVRSMHGFTITRNSELSIDEVASENLLSTIDEELKNRRWGEAVRLNYRHGMPEEIRDFLRDKLDLEDHELYERPGLLNLQDLMEIYRITKDMPDYLDRPFIPRNAFPAENPEEIFAHLRKRDILLHHPYDSFQTVVDLASYAASDPSVLAIKQTLYRTSGDSPIVESLINAAENGKQVTVLVELKARFDEENNIVWARRMEEHGIHVVYGLMGLKIHGKMMQIIRREDDGVHSYTHLSTGNYNPTTAKIYTDLALLTADPGINNDITKLFHAMTGFSAVPNFERIAVAPINLRERMRELIQTEIDNANGGLPARIRIKINNLVDPEMTMLLYQASMAGVKIEMSVRGICCLRPGIPHVSDTIRVESIIGRFLEHSRIYYFENGGNPRLFLSSADMMSRNLNRRMEIFFPVLDQDHVQRLVGILDNLFRDNHNARRLNSDGTYKRVHPTVEAARFSSQRFFREEANKEFEDRERERFDRRRKAFVPLMNPSSQPQKADKS